MPAFIDLPQTDIDTELLVVSGWIAAGTAANASVTVNGTAIHHQTYDRPDVQAALPQYGFTAGITAITDLRALSPAPMLDITLAIEQDRIDRRISVGHALLDRWRTDAARRTASRQFCLDHLRCPACGHDHLDQARLNAVPRTIRCPACDTSFNQSGGAINMISTPLAIEANIAATANVSSNPYTPAALALIERVTGQGGVVLDCGAGSRPVRMPGVINVEIVDYPSTDVLAIGETLPFANASFDAALSLAVLEHVRDPFRCAQELLRVVKPGGELLIDVPFLQPVHGFPHHYYNMTAQGLTNLFAEDARILGCTVPPHGHPAFGVQWLLREYLAGLPPEIAPAFGAMTVDELVGMNVPAFLGDPRAHGLDQAAQSIIACLNALHIQKL